MAKRHQGSDTGKSRAGDLLVRPEWPSLVALVQLLARLLGRQAARESGPASDPQMEPSDEQDAPPTR